MPLRKKFLAFVAFWALLFQAPLSAISLWEEIPHDIVYHIATFTRIKDGIVASEVCKSWQEKWNNESIWRHYARRIPGATRVEEKAEIKYPYVPVNYKVIFQKLMIPKFTVLGGLNKDDVNYSIAVNADGKAVVGMTKDVLASGIDRAFIWEKEHGMKLLGTLNEGRRSSAYAVGGNSNVVVVGEAGIDPAGLVRRAFIWTEKQGMKSLGTLNGGISSSACGVSADGKAVVGYGNDGHDPNNLRSFIWTEEHDMKSLGTLEGHGLTVGAVNADGKIIVGAARGNCGGAVMWIEQEGMLFLERVLKEVLPIGYSLQEATGISADGTIIVGNNITYGKGHSWLAYVPRFDVFKREGCDLLRKQQRKHKKNSNTSHTKSNNDNQCFIF